jgi:hypothetical protein
VWGPLSFSSHGGLVARLVVGVGCVLFVFLPQETYEQHTLLSDNQPSHQARGLRMETQGLKLPISSVMHANQPEVGAEPWHAVTQHTTGENHTT